MAPCSLRQTSKKRSTICGWSRADELESDAGRKGGGDEACKNLSRRDSAVVEVEVVVVDAHVGESACRIPLKGSEEKEGVRRERRGGMSL